MSEESDGWRRLTSAGKVQLCKKELSLLFFAGNAVAEILRCWLGAHGVLYGATEARAGGRQDSRLHSRV